MCTLRATRKWHWCSHLGTGTLRFAVHRYDMSADSASNIMAPALTPAPPDQRAHGPRAHAHTRVQATRVCTATLARRTTAQNRNKAMHGLRRHAGTTPRTHHNHMQRDHALRPPRCSAQAQGTGRHYYQPCADKPASRLNKHLSRSTYIHHSRSLGLMHPHRHTRACARTATQP